MNILIKLKSFVALLFVCSLLLATSLTSCENKGQAAGDEEHPKEEKSEHPAGEAEHPKSDTTKADSVTVN